MAARALTAGAVLGGRRAAGLRTGPAMATATGAQVEAALNRKDVEELVDLNPQQTETVVAVVGGGAPDAGEWVPDGETGVFVPADAGTDTTTSTPPVNGGSSVLDQTVFVREEEMEDVERPAIDMANANLNANANGSNSNN
ncbi:uncharacterized protein LOC100835797 [Brachypodium distachyon]|uniref:Uncharacterized protein n=1 Tax=Brachypodium distachyon TaxID=15368 RepID=I1H1E9_BRADI|nr:uncharacterized protein LOC100835797 [Brachypodium distachyon]PNT76613.1 hypothetical protein BRADI_1g50440v3 [Brachypodium distachyon]|eukprot:XP_003561156.1 uncharacterized protein LOC100835797 [Brachypodium distachyon]